MMMVLALATAILSLVLMAASLQRAIKEKDKWRAHSRAYGDHLARAWMVLSKHDPREVESLRIAYLRDVDEIRDKYR